MLFRKILLLTSLNAQSMATTTPTASVTSNVMPGSNANVMPVLDFLNFADSNITGGASIVDATTSQHFLTVASTDATSGDPTVYTTTSLAKVPVITYTLACMRPTPPAASSLCNEASHYTFTSAPHRLQYKLPVGWYVNPIDASNTQNAPPLTAWWTESCSYSHRYTAAKCWGHWTSFTFPVQTTSGTKISTTADFMPAIDVVVTAGWSKMAPIAADITTAYSHTTSAAAFTRPTPLPHMPPTSNSAPASKASSITTTRSQSSRPVSTSNVTTPAPHTAGFHRGMGTSAFSAGIAAVAFLITAVLL